MSAAGLVLAAGQGRRMGGPKARLLLHGRPLVGLHVERLREAGCAPVLVVARPEDVAWLAALGVAAVASTAPDMAGSLRLGLEALTGADLVVVTPVDVLPATVETVRALARACVGEACVPVAGGRTGHPVVVRCQAVLRRPPGPLREVLSALGPACARLEVPPAEVGGDLDTPEAWTAATGEAPRFA